MRFLSVGLALMMSLSLFTPALAVSVEFSDVSENYWAKDDIAACAAQGIVTGYNGKFNPEDNVTGVQFVSMLTRTFYAGELDQIEIPEGQPWYYPNVTAAENLGISDSTLTFQDNPISRYDMARALYNIIAKNNKLAPDIEAGNAASKIKDYTSIPTNRRGAVCQCYTLGIIMGMTDGTFSGESYMTRAQAAAIIMRMLRLINGYVPEIADSSQPADSTPQPAEQTTEENTEAIPGQTLANGRPVTDENIYELMEQLKAKWPNGTDYYTNFCSSNYAGDALTTICSFSTKTGYKLDLMKGCAGFARAVSDGIYGATGFPARRVTNISELHPGDLILCFDDATQTTIYHVRVVSKVWQDAAGTWWYSSGNCNTSSNVQWDTSSGHLLGNCTVGYSRFPV